MRPVYRPVNGGSKTKRIKYTNQPNAIAEASFRRFREHSKRKRIYPINPNIEVYTLSEHIFGLFHPNCDGGGDVWMYLIVGGERAMLIDTAYGLGDLRGLCDLLSGGRELIVVNTHLGPDHVLGDFRFDHVFCHAYDAENIVNKLKPENCLDYLFDEDGQNRWLQFDREDLPAHKEPELILLKDGENLSLPAHDTVAIVGVPDGYTWKLGEDHEIEMIWTGGHMPGHAMYLDKKNRALFAGDVVCADAVGISGPKPFLKNCRYRNVYTYYHQLLKFKDRFDSFDYVFPGHYLGFIENTVMYDILDTLAAILQDPEGYDFKEIYHSGSGGSFEQMHKRVRGFGDIAYERDSVYPPGEEPEGYHL